MVDKKSAKVDSPAQKTTEKSEPQKVAKSNEKSYGEEPATPVVIYGYAGIHQYKDGSFRVETVGETPILTKRNLVQLYKNSEHPLLGKEIYEDSLAPGSGECFFICFITSNSLFKEFYLELGMGLLINLKNCRKDLPVKLKSTEYGRVVEYIASGDWDDSCKYQCVAVHSGTNAVVGFGSNPVNAYLEYKRHREVDGLRLQDLLFCGASRTLTHEVSKYLNDSGGPVYCEVDSPRTSLENPPEHVADTAGENEYWCVVEVTGKKSGLIHGMGRTGNEAIAVSTCLKSSGKNSRLVDWDARNFLEWKYLPLTRKDGSDGREPVSTNPFITVRCTPELYRRNVYSDQFEKGIPCRLFEDAGSRIADLEIEEVPAEEEVKTTVRMSRQLKIVCQEHAAKRGMGLNEWICRALKEKILNKSEAIGAVESKSREK